MDYAVIASFKRYDVRYGDVETEIRKYPQGTYNIVEVNLGFIGTDMFADEVIQWMADQME